MSEAKDVRLTLKVVINKQKTKVLFAEVDNDFLDVLFSFLILPLGKIVCALEKHYGVKPPHVIGSLDTLYNGLATIRTVRFYGCKPSFLKPESAYGFPFLNQMNISIFNQKNISDHSSDLYTLNEEYFVVLKIFTEEKASFIITDDLHILPNGNGSTVRTLNSIGVDMADIDGAETTSVTFGVNEIMDFLEGLLISRQPLTDIILAKSAKSGCILPSVKSEPGTLLPRTEKEVIYNLNVMYQKSTQKLLFAEAEKDFVSYIATMLTIPLGIADLHLGGNTRFNNLHHLYRSICDLINPKYLEATEKVLLKPETFSTRLLRRVVDDIRDAEGSRMYMITDDLTVTPLCLSSTLSLLSDMKITSSDIEEVELQIGLEEVHNILKASLMSTRALSDGLNNPKFTTQLKPKQEL